MDMCVSAGASHNIQQKIVEVGIYITSHTSVFEILEWFQLHFEPPVVTYVCIMS